MPFSLAKPYKRALWPGSFLNLPNRRSQASSSFLNRFCPASVVKADKDEPVGGWAVLLRSSKIADEFALSGRVSISAILKF